MECEMQAGALSNIMLMNTQLGLPDPNEERIARKGISNRERKRGSSRNKRG